MTENFADPGALFQIEEPTSSKSVKRAPGRGIGIDLGTTHSLVAIAPGGDFPRSLLDSDGESLVPSVVSYVSERPIVGRPALLEQVEHPQQVVSSVKRFMGRGLADIDFAHPYRVFADSDTAGIVRFDVGVERRQTAMEISAQILAELKGRAAAELGEQPDGAVITVPAYFDDAQRQATRDAGRIAGLKVYRLLAEPTAAALAYGLDQGGQGLFAVYDLGGGTFDISVLRLKDGVFQVLATGGDSALGGDDFDRALADELLARAGVEVPNPQQRQEALSAARAAKEALTDREVTTIDLEHVPLRDVTLTRAAFAQLIEPIARKTVRACRKVLKDAGVRAAELDGVVLVGGSTRVPLVRALVEQTFGQAPLSNIDPDRVVAYGAAIQADILSGSARPGVTLLDVVPLSLGLETMGGIVEKLIPRNATIPIGARQVFTNYSEQQTAMMIHVVQGERELVGDCRSLARFELKGIPRLPPSMARVEVSFQLDADALLTVTARELMTGSKQSVEVKPTYGLTDEEVDALVMDSLDHAQDDFDNRNLREARVELGRVALAVKTALHEVGHLEQLLGPQERESIVDALQQAEQTMAVDGAGQSAADVTAVRQRLEELSAPFAQRRMERALASGMGGKTLNEIETALGEDSALDEKRGSHVPEMTEPS